MVGTAGHIDHGKSALVRALTGTDPDRLKEEKERGITIDIGFAHLELAGGAVVSFVDVPGHERFVRNMLAGAHGIDAVVLVVAADESVMPQTREHFEICRLLGLRSGLVALTKCDAAPPELQDVAAAEVAELVAGSFLEGAPVLRVSSRTGAGLGRMREELGRLAEGKTARSVGGPARLPIDRVFTMHGFGTVVTGTLVSGRVAAGDELLLLPQGRSVRVRGVQVHGAAVGAAEAGQRAAVNLAGVELRELGRGDVLASAGSLRPSSMLDVELSLLASAHPLDDDARVRLHVASAEVLARVRTTGGEPIAPGGSGFAQLRLERPAVVGRGDRLVLRAYSPMTTIGGALVLDPLAARPRGNDAGRVARLAALSKADALGAARIFLAQAGAAGLGLPELAARAGADAEELASRLATEEAARRVGREPGALIETAALRRLEQTALAALARFHREQPLRGAMGREELRKLAFARAAEGAFEQALDALAARGELRLVGDGVALSRHEVSLSDEETGARERLLAAARKAGLAGLPLTELGAAAGVEARLAARLGRVLLDAGELVKIGEGLLLGRESLERLKGEVRERWPAGSRLDVGAFKEMTGLSRKFVIPLLEYLDRERVTRRSGADRTVLA
ncbi:MAG: selenocysteine-specific translation elongation factor [Vicinamibacteria bacterium]